MAARSCGFDQEIDGLHEWCAALRLARGTEDPALNLPCVAIQLAIAWREPSGDAPWSLPDVGGLDVRQANYPKRPADANYPCFQRKRRVYLNQKMQILSTLDREF